MPGTPKVTPTVCRKPLNPADNRRTFNASIWGGSLITLACLTSGCFVMAPIAPGGHRHHLSHHQAVRHVPTIVSHRTPTRAVTPSTNRLSSQVRFVQMQRVALHSHRPHTRRTHVDLPATHARSQHSHHHKPQLNPQRLHDANRMVNDERVARYRTTYSGIIKPSRHVAREKRSQQPGRTFAENVHTALAAVGTHLKGRSQRTSKKMSPSTSPSIAARSRNCQCEKCQPTTFARNFRHPQTQRGKASVDHTSAPPELLAPPRQLQKIADTKLPPIPGPTTRKPRLGWNVADRQSIDLYPSLRPGVFGPSRELTTVADADVTLVPQLVNKKENVARWIPNRPTHPAAVPQLKLPGVDHRMPVEMPMIDTLKPDTFTSPMQQASFAEFAPPPIESQAIEKVSYECEALTLEEFEDVTKSKPRPLPESIDAQPIQKLNPFEFQRMEEPKDGVEHITDWPDDLVNPSDLTGSDLTGDESAQLTPDASIELAAVGDKYPRTTPSIVAPAELHAIDAKPIVNAKSVGDSLSLSGIAERISRARENYRMGKLDAANDELQFVLAKHPHHLDALRLQSRVAFDRGDTQTQISNLLTLAKTDADSAKTQNEVGRQLIFLSHKQEGFAALKRAVMLEPNEPRWATELAAAYSEHDQNGDAVKVLDESWRLNPGDTSIARVLAPLKQESGNWPEAISLYDVVLKRVPDDLTARRHRAHCRFHIEDFAGVCQDYVICSRGNDFEFSRRELTEFGDACLRVEDFSAAQIVFDELSDQNEVRDRRIETLRALCALKRGERLQARGIITIALTHWPGDEDLRRMLDLCNVVEEPQLSTVVPALIEKPVSPYP